MTDDPPGNDPTRPRYTPAAVAWLALSDRVRDLVDDALQLAPTLDDHPDSPAEHLAQALRVRARAGKVVGAAILNARAQGLSWAQIALYAGISLPSVAERWAPEEDHWHDLLQRAQDPATGQPEPEDPHVVFAPQAYADDLDTWVAQHIDELRVERWLATRKDAAHPVSGGLPPPEHTTPNRR